MSETQEQTALALIETLVPAKLFAPGNVQEMLKRIEDEVRAQAAELDISTARGRDAIRSLARKVASSKVAMDDAGKALTEEWRNRTRAVNGERSIINGRLDALRDEVRKPLTDWENLEKARVAEHEAALAAVEQIGGIPLLNWETFDPAEYLAALQPYETRSWQEFAQRAAKEIELARSRIAKAVEQKRAHLEAQEQARIAAEQEAERQRIAAEEARQAREAEIARQAAEQARQEAEQRAAAEAARIERERQEAAAREAARALAEQRRREAEAKAERDRIEAERRQAEEERQAAEARAAAAERARLEAIEQAKRAQENAERMAKEAEERAEQRRREEAEQAERDRRAAVEAAIQKEAEKHRLAEKEERRRAENKVHQARINREIVAAFVQIVPEAVAKEVLTAIVRGSVPHVKVIY